MSRFYVGKKRLVALELSVSEAERHGSNLVADLRRRELRSPLLIASDEHARLRKAIEARPGAEVQRCA